MRFLVSMMESERAREIFKNKMLNEPMRDVFPDYDLMVDEMYFRMDIDEDGILSAIQSVANAFVRRVENDTIKTISDATGFQYDDTIGKRANDNRRRKYVKDHVARRASQVAAKSFSDVLDLNFRFTVSELAMIVSEEAIRNDVAAEVSLDYAGEDA